MDMVHFFYAGQYLYFVLEEGDFDKFSSRCGHVLQLIRLGSQGLGASWNTQNPGREGGGDAVYAISPSSEVSK